MARRRLLFVSPRFLLPLDSGGKIRTTEILRNLKGRDFELTLLSPAAAGEYERDRDQLFEFADSVRCWPVSGRGPWRQLRRVAALASALPVSVAVDRSRAGAALVAAELARGADAVVFDFLHSVVLAPQRLETASVLFTHNVETEIFARHAQVARRPWTRALWHDQHLKMERFERAALGRFDRIVAVSQRDATAFRDDFGCERTATIPTGVNAEFFAYREPAAEPVVAFTGAMDWQANIDGIDWLLTDVWPALKARVPAARMSVVGRAPPARLVQQAAQRAPGWSFTGWVDDVRPHLAQAGAYVIPLRVGGGTRIKAFEAMAAGVPVVSTAIGIEGLDVQPDVHYLRADTADQFADAVARLLGDRQLALRLSHAARDHVERNYSNRAVAQRFASIVHDAISSAAHSRVGGKAAAGGVAAAHYGG